MPDDNDKDRGKKIRQNETLLEASSILELRLTPERLTSEIVEFIERCFKPAPKTGARRRAASGSPRGASAARRRSD